jgi:hypothetical protein
MVPTLAAARKQWRSLACDPANGRELSESISRSVSGELTRHLGEVFRKLAVQKESKIGEGHLMPDHVHMMICIPPQNGVSRVIGFVKGKSEIRLARVYGV